MRNKFLCIAMACCVSSPLFAQFSPEEYKNKSNAEVVAEMKIAVEQIKSIERLSKMFKDEAPVFYDKDELEPAFKLDTVAPLAVFADFKGSNFSIIQSFNSEGSELHINDGDFHGNLSGKAYSIKMIPKRFYFYDGTYSDSVQNIEMDFSFTEDIPFKKRIDSIACTLELSRVTAFDKVEVTTLKPTASYKSHFVKLLKAEKNDIEVIFDSDFDFDFVEGLNAADKPLDDKSQTTSDYRNRDFKVFSTILKPLEKIIAAAEKDTNLAVADFQQKYIKALEQELDKLPDSDTTLRVAKYKGAVKGMRFWIATEQQLQQVSLTIKAASFSNVHFEYGKDDEKFIRDNDGEVIFSSKAPLMEITPHFYEEEERFFYFNSKSREMEALPYASVEALTTDYVSAKTTVDGDAIILNNKNENLGAFDVISASGGAIIAERGADILVLSPSGKQTRIKDAEIVSEFYNGHAALLKNGKYGFVNLEGKLVIPFEYERVQPFKDMDGYTEKDLLFGVRKGDKWGFVNAENKQVIPFEYEEILPFSYGITMAIKDGKRGLINTANKAIVPFNNSTNYAMSTNFGKRLYSLSSGSYNYLGQKVKE